MRVQCHALAALYPPGKTRYPSYRRLGGPQVQSGRVENLAPTRIQSLDHPARSQSLYLVNYPAHLRVSEALHRKSTAYKECHLKKDTILKVQDASHTRQCEQSHYFSHL